MLSMHRWYEPSMMPRHPAPNNPAAGPLSNGRYR